MTDIKTRLRVIEDRVGEAASRSGRAASEVSILPITKGHPASILEAVAEIGMTDIGENRVREAQAKQQELGKLGLSWHMVGHLQRNKVSSALPLFDMFESVDSVRLARRLSTEASASGQSEVRVLAQVNTSGEAAKGGFTEETVRDELSEIVELPGLAVVGMMTMAPWTDDTSVLRGTFRSARALFDRCAAAVDGFRPEVLSMGMSNDFEIAIEEGSTQVRLGTALLGERRKR
ncbi:MAG: YggS family pyridoxal phosphate-dependent enzyme [Gemmatimonadota bacterium]